MAKKPAAPTQMARKKSAQKGAGDLDIRTYFTLISNPEGTPSDKSTNDKMEVEGITSTDPTTTASDTTTTTTTSTSTNDTSTTKKTPTKGKDKKTKKEPTTPKKGVEKPTPSTPKRKPAPSTPKKKSAPKQRKGKDDSDVEMEDDSSESFLGDSGSDYSPGTTESEESSDDLRKGRSKVVVTSSESEAEIEEIEDDEPKRKAKSTPPKPKPSPMKSSSTPRKSPSTPVKSSTPKSTPSKPKTPRKSKSTPSKQLSIVPSDPQLTVGHSTIKAKTKKKSVRFRRKPRRDSPFELNAAPIYPNKDIVCLRNHLPQISLVDSQEQYLPKIKCSKDIRFTSVKNETFKIDVFKSTIHNIAGEDEFLMYCGGNIRALEWCPLPRTIEKQYLAVATNQDYLTNHLRDLRYRGKNIIQIWEFDTLNNDGTNEDEPKFLFGFTIESDFVISMKWVTNGVIYQEERDDEISRLGLLSAVLGDGSIKVWSIPGPSLISSFKTKIVTLKPFFDYLLPTPNRDVNNNNNSNQNPLIHHDMVENKATGLDLYSVDSNQVLMLVGTNLGMIMIFDLGAEVITDPIFFRRDLTPVENVLFCPFDSFYFLVQNSKNICLWDRRDCKNYLTYKAHNIYTFKQGLTWPNSMVPGFVQTLDDGIRVASLTYGNSTMFRVHSDTIRGVDSSQQSIVATASANGEAMIFEIQLKRVKYSEFPLLVVAKQSIIDEVLVLSDANESKNFLEFTPAITNKLESSALSVVEPSSVLSVFPDPLVGLNCIRWNKNQGKVEWIAVGGTLGIVRVKRVDILVQKKKPDEIYSDEEEDDDDDDDDGY